MKKNKTKTKTHAQKLNQRKYHKNKKEELTKKKGIFELKAVGRLEPATFRFVGERVNHQVTVVSLRLCVQLSILHAALTETFSNPNCKLISLYQKFQCKLHQVSYKKKKY